MKGNHIQSAHMRIARSLLKRTQSWPHLLAAQIPLGENPRKLPSTKTVHLSLAYAANWLATHDQVRLLPDSRDMSLHFHRTKVPFLRPPKATGIKCARIALDFVLVRSPLSFKQALDDSHDSTTSAARHLNHSTRQTEFGNQAFRYSEHGGQTSQGSRSLQYESKFPQKSGT